MSGLSSLTLKKTSFNIHSCIRGRWFYLSVDCVLKTVLIPCGVPWSISPSTSGVTLIHRETDVQPECSVVFGGGRLQDSGRTDDRRIEITFNLCYYSRTGPHSDTEGVEAIGYDVVQSFEGAGRDYLEWRQKEWQKNGLCPDSGFYVAHESAWLQSLPNFFHKDYRHYVIDGRDGYVELIAKSFKWREWLWRIPGHREDAPRTGPVVGQGEGIA